MELCRSQIRILGEYLCILGSWFALREVFLGALVGHTLVWVVLRGDHFFSLVIPFIFCSFLWECPASGDVLRYLGSGESCHATTQTCTNTNRTVRLSHPVHTSPFVMSFV